MERKESHALPLASPVQEDFAREQFPIDEPAGRYAAANAHAWISFSFDQYRYSDDRLTAWICELGDILFGRNGAPSIEQLREKYLSPAQRRKVEAEQARQLRDGDL